MLEFGVFVNPARVILGNNHVAANTSFEPMIAEEFKRRIEHNQRIMCPTGFMVVSKQSELVPSEQELENNPGRIPSLLRLITTRLLPHYQFNPTKLEEKGVYQTITESMSQQKTMPILFDTFSLTTFLQPINSQTLNRLKQYPKPMLKVWFATMPHQNASGDINPLQELEYLVESSRGSEARASMNRQMVELQALQIKHEAALSKLEHQAGILSLPHAEVSHEDDTTCEIARETSVSSQGLVSLGSRLGSSLYAKSTTTSASQASNIVIKDVQQLP